MQTSYEALYQVCILGMNKVTKSPEANPDSAEK